MISERTLCSKDFVVCLSDIFVSKNCNFDFYKISNKLASIPFLYFRMNLKRVTYFSEVGDLKTKNILVFCLYRVTLFKCIANSINFYKSIFLNVIPAC